MSHLICSVRLGYENAAKLKELSPDAYEEIRTKFVSLHLPEKQEDIASYSTYEGTEYMADLELMTLKGLQPTIHRIRGQMVEGGMQLPPNPTATTQITNITIPNAALFAVTNVVVLEDECTDKLQQNLDNGWRIVAVCPPNDTRRPSYILGHTDRDARRSY